MRLAPRSLAGRLTLAAAVLTLVALVGAGLAIGFILQRFVTQQVEQRLDAQTTTIADALERDADGRLRLSRNVDGPPFDRRRSGWYWRVDEEGAAVLRSGSLGDEGFESGRRRPLPAPFDPRWREPKPKMDEGRGPAEEPLIVRATRVDVGGRPVEIAVAAPLGAVAGPMRDALRPLALSLAAVGLGLVGASLLQVRFGLTPLRRLREALGEVRAGRAARVPDDQPAELKPLASELNALIEQNAAGLASARLHVANLAHGLKTPLATLSVALDDPGRDPDGALRAEVDRVERRIRHHLARARAAALGGPQRMRTELKPRIDDLAVALKAIHAGKTLSIAVDVADDLHVACDPQDVDEMAGNLLDNACKWARGAIVVHARRSDAQVALTISDDGPGLPEDALPEAMLPGRRLDETTPGHGFGLSIARELAELYGGGLTLERGPAGGLAARLTLPAQD